MKTNAKDFFLNVGVMAALYVSAVSLLTLVFQITDLSFPDKLESRFYYIDPYSTGLRWAMASLFIVFPIYLILNWILNREYGRAPEKRGQWIRKWLIYITLFAAGVALAVDLITLIHYFLGGEITVRFVLKVLAVLVVAAAIFGYYLREAVSERGISARLNKIFASVLIIVVLASIVGGFTIMGSPFTVRLQRFDERKVEDLRNLQWQVISYWQQKEVLPDSLEKLIDPISDNVLPNDPQSDRSYEYRLISPLKFELCAEFNLPTPTRHERVPSQTYPVSDGFENWQHESGRQCFVREIDPDRYPPNAAGLIKPKPLID